MACILLRLRGLVVLECRMAQAYWYTCTLTTYIYVVKWVLTHIYVMEWVKCDMIKHMLDHITEMLV